ncbi:MAG: glycosyltransferase family 39 protein [Anaerolineae bacterium]|nr:glycosyltransferase family 39 protein [Anaerolineae bacterium]
MNKQHRTPLGFLKVAPIPLITVMGAALRLFRLNSVPPGLHFDEAVYGLMALDIYHGHFPVFFSAYTGREPLYMYLMAAVFRLVGVGPLGIRLTSALTGIATIPLTFLLFRELFSRRLGIIAAALTAFSYWHLTVSRNGYPNILIPPLESLALYFLWRGYRDGRRGLMALGGAFVGGVLYTYLAARLFPVTMAAFFIYAFLVDRQRFIARLSELLLAALVSILVFAPLGLHFLTHPHDFWERTSQVLAVGRVAQNGLARLIASNFTQTLGGFFLRGDPRWHYNLPGKPIFDPIMAAFFVLGLLITIRNWRKPDYLLLPIWVVGMCLPAVLTEDAMPQGQRMFGIIPAIFGLAALGIDTVLSALSKKIGVRVLYGALAVLLAFEGLSTANTYFNNWARQPNTFYTFHSDYVLLAEQARKELDAGHAVVIQSQHYKHPTVIFSEPRTLDAVWTVGGKSLVIPNCPTTDLVYLRPTVDTRLDKDIEAIQNRITESVWHIPDPRGSAAVSVYRLKPEAVVVQGNPLALLNDEVELLDYTLPSSTPRDQPLRVLVCWRVAKPVAEGRTLVLHLVDENGHSWSQGGETGYLTEQWHPGDVVYQLFEVRLPAGIPAGRYQARLILAREDGVPLPVVRNGQLTGTFFPLGDVILETAGRFIQPISSSGIPFGQELQVIAHGKLKTTVGLGGAVQLAVTWQATAKTDENYRVIIELADEGGSVRGHYEMPLAYQYPTSEWQPGEVVQTFYPLSLHSLPVGFYYIRLRVGSLTGELALGQVRIEGGERIFTVPPIEHPLVVHLGNEIDLVGYDLSGGEYQAGETIDLRLYWQARTPIAGDYKVFVHLVGEGEQIWSQRDSIPADWQRPTTGWEVGEVIVDEHRLSIPPDTPQGRYTIFIGMYDSATMQRLPLINEGGQRLPDDRLPLATINIK